LYRFVGAQGLESKMPLRKPVKRRIVVELEVEGNVAEARVAQMARAMLMDAVDVWWRRHVNLSSITTQAAQPAETRREPAYTPPAYIPPEGY